MSRDFWKLTLALIAGNVMVSCTLLKTQGAPAPGRPADSPLATDPGLGGLTGEEWVTIGTALGSLVAVIGHRYWFHAKRKS